ncbi:hypothetical protein [Nocardia nepalensis]
MSRTISRISGAAMIVVGLLLLIERVMSVQRRWVPTRRTRPGALSGGGFP